MLVLVAEQIGLGRVGKPRFIELRQETVDGGTYRLGEFSDAHFGHSVFSLRNVVFEPGRPGGHDELARAFVVNAGHLHQLVRGQIGQIVTGDYPLGGKPACEITVHSVELDQRLVGHPASQHLLVRDLPG